MPLIILTTIFTWLLVSCTAIGPGPSIEVVQQALQLQISQTQTQFVQQLGLSKPPQIKINRLSISQWEPLMIENLQSFRLSGNYDVTFKLPKREINYTKKSFELYLQRQKQAQTWRLARPLNNTNPTEKAWATYLIPPLDY